nr:alpha/beta fold hydrolase [Desulfuromonas sp.]
MRERKDYAPSLPSFRLPCLVIGAEQDRAIPPDQSEALAAGLPDSTLRLLPGGGHMVNLEQPEAFNAALVEFLDGLGLQ